MKKKYLIRDEDTTYEVEEIDEDTEEVPEQLQDEDTASLTPEEISQLKKLLPHVDEILAMLTPEESVGDEDEDEDIEEEVNVDEDENEEEIVDTCKDSKKSIKDSAVANRKAKVQDSDDSLDAENEINKAWAERFTKYSK